MLRSDGKKELVMILKKCLPKEEYRKLKLLREQGDFVLVARRAIINNLNSQKNFLEKEINKLAKLGKDFFFAKNKLILLPSKIEHLKANFSMDEFIKVLALIQSIKEECKNV